MNRLQNILLGTDFSPGAKAALQQASRVADWNNAKLHVLHVVNVLALREYSELFQVPFQLVEKEAAQHSCEHLKQWIARSGVSVQGVSKIGMPLEEILNRVTESQANLLVLGLRGESTVQNEAGLLALKCLRKAPTKVMLVHEQHAGPFRDVVCCVDFSETSREAVEQARHVGQQDGSWIHFIHVHSSSWQGLQFHWEENQPLAERTNQYRALLLERLKQFVGDVSGLNAWFEIIESEVVAHGISEYAHRAGTDLLILGSKGQSNLKVLVLGSTVERLVRQIPCSILVVRPPVS